MNNKKRLIVSLVLLSLLATVAIFGTFAFFGSSATASTGNLFATGTLTETTDHPASAIATLSNMVPGDSSTGLVQVNNTGSEDITSPTLAVALTSATSLLDSDATKGLHLYVSRCSVAWTGVGVAATCTGGTTTDVIGTSAVPVPIVGSYSEDANALCSTSALAISQRTARGDTCGITGSDYLKVRVNLPDPGSLDNSVQGLSSTFSFTFSGSQPPAHNF